MQRDYLNVMKKEKNIAEIGSRKIDRKCIHHMSTKLIFNVPDFLDLELLETKFKEGGLDEIEVFHKKELEGLISVPVNNLDIKSAVHEAKHKIVGIIKDVIVESGFANKIKEDVKGNKSTETFIKWVRVTHKALKDNQVTREAVKDKIVDRYSDLLHEEGIKTLVNLFSQDKEHIIDSWAKLEDFFLKKLALEFYIVRQLSDASFVMVLLESDDQEVKSIVMNSQKLIVPITDDVEFYRRDIALPYGKKISNIFTHDKLEKVLMLFNPSKATYSFLQKIMALRKSNSDLNFISYVIEKQNTELEKGLNNLEFDAEFMRNGVVDLNVSQIDPIIKSLDYLIQMFYFNREEYIVPCKKVVDKFSKRKKVISSHEYKKHFEQKVTSDNIRDLIKPAEWMMTLIPEFNIDKTEQLLEDSEKMHLQFMKLLRELREHLIKYRDTKKKGQFRKLKILGPAIVKILWELGKLKMGMP